MTTSMEVRFPYTQHPTEDTLRAVSALSEVYGIRRVRLNQPDRSVLVEYDATRFGRDTVLQLLHRAGLAVTEQISPSAAPVEEELPDEVKPEAV